MKKIIKIVLLLLSVAAIAAAAAYFIYQVLERKRVEIVNDPENEDEEYTSEIDEDLMPLSSREYVSLTPEQDDEEMIDD